MGWMGVMGRALPTQSKPEEDVPDPASSRWASKPRPGGATQGRTGRQGAVWDGGRGVDVKELIEFPTVGDSQRCPPSKHGIPKNESIDNVYTRTQGGWVNSFRLFAAASTHTRVA